MMTLGEFQTVLHPILARWPRAYSGDQVSLIHDELKMISRADCERLVRYLLGSLRLAPMIPDFKKAILDLSIRPTLPVGAPSPVPTFPQGENYLYHLKENVYADNKYIFIRDVNPTFIIKADHPTHPLVLLDSELRGQKLKELKANLARLIPGPHKSSEGMKRVFAVEEKA